MGRLMEEIRERAVSAKPVYSLSECIKIDKDFLETESAEAEELSQEDTDELIEEIKESFSDCVRYGNDKKLNIIRKYVEERDAPIEKADSGGDDDGEVSCFHEFYEDNIIYPFTWEDKLYLILPDELVQIYQEIVNAPDFAAVSAYNAELLKYATALTNLYGVCEISQFINVWNTHHKEKLSDYSKTAEILEKLGMQNYSYFAIDGYLLADGIWLDSHRDQLLERVEGLEYYMPLKSVIALYAKEDYYMEIPGAKEMSEFLSQYIPEKQREDENKNIAFYFSGMTKERILDFINHQIARACKRVYRPAFIRQELEKAGIGFILNDAEAVAKFEKLFMTLRENTRIWEFRGLTPYQHELQNGKMLPKFDLLEEDEPEEKESPKAENKREKRKKGKNRTGDKN